ncbi:WD40 repeat-like protein, partial [Macrolepiota fuliginosa MF-IS2]
MRSRHVIMLQEGGQLDGRAESTMALPKRRISYVVPPPTDPPPRLQLPPYGTPRLGAIGPLLIPLPVGRPHSDSSEHKPRISRHPRHRLGVASLALDTSTQLIGNSSPEGILYTGGRDGLVISWDLGIATKKRKAGGGKSVGGKWEVLTGWADEGVEEEGEEDDQVVRSDGDILGDVSYRRQRTPQRNGEFPYEHQWETDITAFKPGTRSHFRQCAEAHSDWVNDIALCNYNQTVVSASSDGTVKAWNPHSPTNSDPIQIGSHNDYVRCLTYCREQNWVASGSFDRTIRLWDLNTSNAKQALVTLNPPDATAPKSSVYALACDHYGRTIASGSPERVVRLWDPRSGKRTGKLVGHTDNIRAILISEDAKYLLTGSADASIKLWSLTSQRCLHTFTHHTDSVWSLFSTHPSLEIFYSGDRSGLVCRVDVEDCTDVSEGECILLCQDHESPPPSSSDPPGTTQHPPTAESTNGGINGVNRIVVMDDNLLWTASGTSSIRRWQVPTRRALRLPVGVSVGVDGDGERIPFSEYSPIVGRRRVGYEQYPYQYPYLEATTPPRSDRSPRASFAPSMDSISSERDRDGGIESRDHRRHSSAGAGLGSGSGSGGGGGGGGGEEGDRVCGIPMDSLVRLVSPNDPFSSFSHSAKRDPEVATLYSAASVMSVPKLSGVTRAAHPGFFGSGQGQGQGLQASVSASSTVAQQYLNTSRTEDTFTLLPGHLQTQTSVGIAKANYEERELAADAVPLLKEPEWVVRGEFGLVRSVVLGDRVHVLTVDTSGEVAVWDVVRGVCRG